MALTVLSRRQSFVVGVFNPVLETSYGQVDKYGFDPHNPYPQR